MNLITIFQSNMAIFVLSMCCILFYFCLDFETKFNIQFEFFEVYNFFLKSFILNSFQFASLGLFLSSSLRVFWSSSCFFVSMITIIISPNKKRHYKCCVYHQSRRMDVECMFWWLNCELIWFLLCSWWWTQIDPLWSSWCFWVHDNYPHCWFWITNNIFQQVVC